MSLCWRLVCALTIVLIAAELGLAAEFPGDLVTSKNIPVAPQPGSKDFEGSAAPDVKSPTAVVGTGSRGTFSFAFSWTPARIEPPGKKGQLVDWIWYGYRVPGCKVRVNNKGAENASPPGGGARSYGGYDYYTFPEPSYEAVATCPCDSSPSSYPPKKVNVAVKGAGMTNYQPNSMPVTANIDSPKCLIGK